MATMKTIELPIRAILDDEDRRRIRAVANALTKASGAVAELAEAFAVLADGGRTLDDTVKETVIDDAAIKVGDKVRVIEGAHRHGATDRFVGRVGTVNSVDDAISRGVLLQIELLKQPGGDDWPAPDGGWYIDSCDVEKIR